MLRTHSSVAISGTFSVGYAGDSTDSLPFDVSEEAMELALEALPQIRDVQVTRASSAGSAAGGYEWSVTFLSEAPVLKARRL